MSLTDEVRQILMPIEDELWSTNHPDPVYSKECREFDLRLVVNKVLDAAVDSIESVTVFQKYAVNPTESIEKHDFISKKSVLRELNILKQ